MKTATGFFVAAALFCASTAHAQATPAVLVVPVGQEDKQHDLEQAHSVLQKSSLAALGVTGVLGVLTAVNKDTLFWDGRCGNGNPIFGRFGCTGLPLVHFVFGVITEGLFISSEIVAENMPVNPYNSADGTRQDAMRTLRVIDISLFAVQPVLGLLAAHPGLIGIPENARPMFSRVLRTIHMGTGVSVAGTYTATAALQW